MESCTGGKREEEQSNSAKTETEWIERHVFRVRLIGLTGSRSEGVIPCSLREEKRELESGSGASTSAKCEANSATHLIACTFQCSGLQAGDRPPELVLEGLCSASSSIGNFSLDGPSTASLIKDIVVSMLLLLVLGLVIVVPQLAVLPCPFLNPPGVLGVAGLIGLGLPAMLGLILAVAIDKGPLVGEVGGSVVIPFLAMELRGERGGCSSTGVVGFEKYVSGSTKSGGRRSFSISDLRASSKLVMASLMPSAPITRVP